MGRAAVIVGLLLTSAGCHLIFPHERGADAAATDLWRPDGSPPDRSDLGLADWPRDSASPASPLDCMEPELVGKDSPSLLSEVALRSDGLELVAQGGQKWYSTQRPTRAGVFGAWSQGSKITTQLAGKQDPTFFKIDDAEQAIVAYSVNATTPRFLQHCTFEPFACTPLTILDSAGKVITVDLDGPSVALPGGKVLMAHNLGQTNTDGLVYLATPDDPAKLAATWSTAKVLTLDRPGVREDDPALSPDGLVLVVGGTLSSTSDYDLWVSRRAGLEEPFPAQVQIGRVNSSADDVSPYLAAISVSSGPPRYELFFSSARESGRKIYRAECW